MEKVEYGDAVAAPAVVVPAPTVTLKRVVPKKRTAMSIFRAVAFFALGGCSPAYMPRKKTIRLVAPSTGGADAVLQSLVGGMRPLGHLHIEGKDDDALPSASASASVSAAFPHLPPPPPESFHDVLLPPSSPAYGGGDCMSRYASAQDLLALDDTADGGGAEAAPGDGAIDVKAEEFIANFYEQMRLQRSDSAVDVDQEPAVE